MELDIRSSTDGVVDSIRVYSVSEGGPCLVDSIRLLEDGVVMYDTISLDALALVSKEHATDVIKGINKAIELGWLK